MDRVVNKSDTFAQADAWDVQQQSAMSPVERMRIARELKRRAYPEPVKDIRECHRNR